MDLEKLHSRDTAEVRAYVDQKFRAWKDSWRWSSWRNSKVLEYYVACRAREHAHVQAIIREKYFQIFHEPWPADKAAIASAGGDDAPQRLARNIKNEMDSRYVNLMAAVADLKKWKEEQRCQGGQEFFVQLRARVHGLDDKICDPHLLRSEVEVKRNEILRSQSLGANGGDSEFEAMFGLKQTAEFRFENRSEEWGVIKAKLEESVRLGAWTRANASAKFDALGLSTEAKAVIAIGAEFTVGGDLSWSKGDKGVKLGGGARLNAGAEAGAEMALSISAKEGIRFAMEAGAFAGVSAEVSGKFVFTYMENDAIEFNGAAKISMGVGAKFSVSVDAPIFGPTAIGLEADVSLGLGAGVDAKISIDFDLIALGAASEFKKIYYYTTIEKGYSAELMLDEAKNRHYLDKAISTFESEIEFIDAQLGRRKAKPVDQRALMDEMDADDD